MPSSDQTGPVNTYLLHGDRGDDLKDGPGGGQDDEGERQCRDTLYRDVYIVCVRERQRERERERVT